MLFTSRFLALGLCALVAPGEPPHHPTPGGVLVADGGLGGVLDIVEHTVRVTVHDGIAVTHLEQVFLNTENRVVEALYLFPVPRGASVANFSMWINGKEMVGEVVEKARARQIYDSYKRKNQDPGLLEQTDFKTFAMRIFPIPAKARQKVALSYYQELEFDHDQATYVYPLATSPRPGIVERATGKFAITFEVLSDAPIVSFDCPSHKQAFVVAKHSPKVLEASLEASGGDLSRDVVLTYKVDQPRTGLGLITSKPEGEDGYFAMTLTAGDELEQPEQGTDYVFLLDVSGSMADDGKLGLSRRSIDAFVQALAPEDRFELMTFSLQPSSLFSKLTAATPETRQRAVTFLASQEARGGTRLRPAMALAYRHADPDRVLNVVVLSDGMTEQQERTELMELIRARPANSRVFCIGIGNDVERPLLQRVAESAGGFTAFVSQQDDFERQAKAFRRKVARPAARDVRLTFGGADVYDVEPKQLPDLFHGMPLRVYGRYRNGGKARIALDATVAGRELRRDFDLDLSKPDGDARIERMWAWQRIQRLRHLEPAPVDEIVRLGEGYSIATEWTSFLVLENDAEYQRWQIARKNATRIARDRKVDAAVTAQLTAIRDRAMPGLGPDAADAAPQKVTVMAPQRTAPLPARDAPELAPSQPRSNGNGIGAIDPYLFAVIAGMALLGWQFLRRSRS